MRGGESVRSKDRSDTWPVALQLRVLDGRVLRKVFRAEMGGGDRRLTGCGCIMRIL